MFSAAPTITAHPTNILSEEGETASFTCEFNGSPYPVTYARWLKGERILKDLAGHSTIFPHNGTLVIHKISMSDSGDYSCEVITNGFSPVRSESATLFVKGNYRQILKKLLPSLLLFKRDAFTLTLSPLQSNNPVLPRIKKHM